MSFVDIFHPEDCLTSGRGGVCVCWIGGGEGRGGEKRKSGFETKINGPERKKKYSVERESRKKIAWCT